MGFAMTRREARQLVSHAHFTVNGKKVNIPSYLGQGRRCDRGRREPAAPPSASSACWARTPPVFLLPVWMEREKNALKGTVTTSACRARISTFPLRSTSSLSCTPSNRRIPSIMIGIAGGAQQCVRRNEKMKEGNCMIEIEKPQIECIEDSGERLLRQVRCRAFGAWIRHYAGQRPAPHYALFAPRHRSYRHQDRRCAA